MKVLPVAWRRDMTTMVGNASSLVGTTATLSALGYVYWAVAARGFTLPAVGIGSTALSVTVVLGTAATFGLGTLLIGELPRQPGRAGTLISTALVISFLTGATVGFAFAVAAPAVSSDLAPLRFSAVTVLLCSLGVGLSAATLVLDQALIGLLLGGVQMGRNALFAVAKLAALVIIVVASPHRTALALYATWVFGQGISCAALALLLLTRGAVWRSCRPDWATGRSWMGRALAHHALNVALQAPSLMLPLVVTIVLSATMTAYFYAAWMVASLAFVAPMALSTVLYAAGSREPLTLPSKTRLTLRLAVLAGLLAASVLFSAAPMLMQLFGPAYATFGTQSVRLLALAVFPLLVKDHYVTICRLRLQIGRAAMWTAAGGLLELFFAGIGARIGGMTGITVGYVAAASIEALAMGHVVYRVAVQDLPFSLPRPMALLRVLLRAR